MATKLDTSSEAVVPMAPASNDTETELPAYAVPDPLSQRAEARIRVGLALALLSIPGATVAVVGAMLAVTSLVLVTTSRRLTPRRTYGTLAIICAIIGLAISLCSYAWVRSQYSG